MARKTGKAEQPSECENPDECQCILSDSKDESGEFYTLESLELFENHPNTGSNVYLCPTCFHTLKYDVDGMGDNGATEEFSFQEFVDKN